MISAVFLFSTFLLGSAALPTCKQDKNCFLPDCFCPTFEHPYFRGNVKDIPQIVYFGFDDAVTPTAYEHYNKIFTESRRNPNGCPITMSLYVQNRDTVYSLVDELYKKGMEIGSHSVTHVDLITEDELRQEAEEQRSNLAKSGIVPINDVVGWRSPNLKTAGDDQPDVLKNSSYTYDISLSYTRIKANDPTPWPYTLDYGYPYGCPIPPCPAKNSPHQGFWEIPINLYFDPKTNLPCSYVDGCRPSSCEDALDFLWYNFNQTYHAKRAPFGLNMHAAWFSFPGYRDATEAFIDGLLQKGDVYIISAKQMLEWMKNPVPMSEVGNLTEWGCANPVTNSPQSGNSSTATATPQSPITTQATTVPPTPQTVDSTTSLAPVGTCEQDVTCHLPDCQCQSDQPPANNLPVNIPQFVLFTIEPSNSNGVITERTHSNIAGLFDHSRQTPNNCPLTTTLFVPPTVTKLEYVQHFRRLGHEIAVLGSGKNSLEVSDELDMFEANTGKKSIGYRTTNAEDENMLKALSNKGLQYDSSFSTSRNGSYDIAWPYTLNYGLDGCATRDPSCPRLPGVWEVPKVPLLNDAYFPIYPCGYADSCFSPVRGAEGTYDFLKSNLRRAFNTNRAPLRINLRANWFSHHAYTENVEGLKLFLDNLSKDFGDQVYVTSIEKMLNWMRNPTELQNINSFPFC